MQDIKRKPKKRNLFDKYMKTVGYCTITLITWGVTCLFAKMIFGYFFQ